MLSISHLSKSFGPLNVLRDISFSVRKGEVVSIIGPSGSGKSTLLRCATMLETADSGTISYENLRILNNGKYAGKSVLKQARNRFGLVFQSFNLFPHYSVLKNIIDAPVCVQKRNRAEVIEEAKLLLHKIGLEGREDAYPYQLSGGQQQRVAIARALAMNPDILFFDEPTSALDPELTAEILKVIRQLAEEHMTMVIVTHEINFARNVSDRIVFMADGVIVEQGSAEQLVDNPQNERTRAFLANIGKGRD
ncbi:amino acid ABC transporter ATP-binding protein [bacterium]|nr:amino acid ABC transporter ATP-binding protein [bacterium]